MSKRLEREKATVQSMIRIFCKKQHHTLNGLCSQCQELSDYASNRLDHCKFGDTKPTCGKCTVHCYKPEMRKRIQEIMRYAGPKMIFAHPLMGVRHLLDGFRKVT
jgi:Nitrous oxide-stimulated promoter.